MLLFVAHLHPLILQIPVYVTGVYRVDVSITLSGEPKLVDLSLGLKLTMDYYLVLDVVVGN